jgi:cyclopropane-fatty-acyl-phospholipid synthase
MVMLFPYLMKRLIKKGTLRLITSDGQCHASGCGAPYVSVKLHRKILEWTLALRPDLKIGEAYSDGLLTIEEGNLRDFLFLLFVNYDHARHDPVFKWFEYLSHTLLARQFNSIFRARENISYHYDLSDEFYDLFLDKDRQYSCGYFTAPNNSLDQAQHDKKRHIAAKLLLNRKGLTVLDIGSGWGGLGLYLARECGCEVTGVTLSIKQYEASRERAKRGGISKSCRFKLQDYRQERSSYNRIVSVGMFEHVGKKNYDEFFSHIRDLLTDDGVCLLHTISRSSQPESVNAFIRKHIFPGTDVPSLSEIMEPIQRSGLYTTDVEILRLHYAMTLKKWTERFVANKVGVVSLYGESFYREWHFYLISCELGFRYDYLLVAQIQLTKRLETIPLTRDYICDWEQSSACASDLCNVEKRDLHTRSFT